MTEPMITVLAVVGAASIFSVILLAVLIVYSVVQSSLSPTSDMDHPFEITTSPLSDLGNDEAVIVDPQPVADVSWSRNDELNRVIKVLYTLQQSGYYIAPFVEKNHLTEQRYWTERKCGIYTSKPSWHVEKLVDQDSVEWKQTKQLNIEPPANWPEEASD